MTADEEGETDDQEAFRDPLLMGTMLFWGQAIPAGAQPLVPGDVHVEDLLVDADPVENDQTFELLNWGDIDGAVAGMSALDQDQQEQKRSARGSRTGRSARGA